MLSLRSDPLYVIFEKYLYESANKSSAEFTTSVVNDYINYLKCSGAVIPPRREHLIVEEVKDEVEEVLKKVLKFKTSIKSYLEDYENIDELKDNSSQKYRELF